MPEVAEQSEDIRGGLPDIKGSTVLILRVLYESLIPSKTAQTKATNLLLILDTEAARKKDQLPEINTLSNITSAIDTGISRLPKDKSALKDEFLRRNAGIQSDIGNLRSDFQEKVTEQYDGIIVLHNKVRDLLSKESSQERKDDLMKEIDNLKIKTAEFKKLCDTYTTKYEALQATQSVLRTDVARNVPISGEGKEVPAPTPGGSS